MHTRACIVQQHGGEIDVRPVAKCGEANTNRAPMKSACPPVPLRCALIALLLAFFAPAQAAELRLAGLFTDHMVLQREQAAPVWGWANAGEEITVQFAGQKKTGKADATGKWMVKLDALPASSEGRELLAQSSVKGRVAKIADVVVGDVWLCSGQSNMRFQVSRADNAAKEIAASANPALRFFIVQDHFAKTPVPDVKGAWNLASPATIADCSAVGYYFGVALQPKLGVPVGLLVSSIGGTRIETWSDSATLAKLGVADRLIEKWKNVSPEELVNVVDTYKTFQQKRDGEHSAAVRAAKASGAPAPLAPKAPPLRPHDCPSALHNGMIFPLQPFALKGSLWYQGEANVASPAAYEKLQPALIADWRRVWGAEMPFLFVQLAPHNTAHPAFREAQLRIWQMTPHTAMVVTSDIGNATDIHPIRKRPVGERLALAARALTYGEQLEYSGPVFNKMSIKESSATISFTHVGQGLVAKGGALKGFTIAGADGKFVPANAVIEGANVIVTSEQIAKPAAVRYGWANVPEVNLFNQEGLPASPFRTDGPANTSRD